MFDPSERDQFNRSAGKIGSDARALAGALTRVNGPAIYLRRRLAAIGYEFKNVANNDLRSAERIFFIEATSASAYTGLSGTARRIGSAIRGKTAVRDVFGECVRLGIENRMVLFLWEAPAVSPANWDPRWHKRFPVIFTCNDQYADNSRIFKIVVPQPAEFPRNPEIPFSERKLLVNISMNKSARHPRELYSARRTSIRYFERNFPDQFDLYGLKWDRLAGRWGQYFPRLVHPYRSYRGSVMNKWEVMPRYRFSLCYENIRDEPGYVTEKIFDSLRCGCVPIYWGASNIDKYVDPSAFIDRRKFRDDRELAAYLSQMTAGQYEKFRSAIYHYLASEQFTQFLPCAYADTIINKLGL